MEDISKRIDSLMKNNPFYCKYFKKISSLDVNRNISFVTVKETFHKIIKYKDILKSESFDVFSYTDIEYLNDDIVKVIQNSQKKSFTHSFLSKKYHKLITDNVYNIFGELKQLGISRETIQEQFIDSVAAYKTSEKFEEGALNFLESVINSDIISIKNKAKDFNTQILYENHEKNILILRILDYKASKNLGNSRWCISYNSNFWHNYVGNQTGYNFFAGNKQLFFYDFNLPSTDRNSFIGITLNKNNNLKYAYDKTNSSAKKYIENSFVKNLIENIEYVNVKDTIDFILKSRMSFTKKVEFILETLPNHLVSFIKEYEYLYNKNFIKSNTSINTSAFLDNINKININEFIENNLKDEDDFKILCKVFKKDMLDFYFILLSSNSHSLSFIDTVSNIIEKDGFIKSIIENKKLHRFYPKNFSYEQLVNLIINIDLLINENILDKSEFIFFDKKFKFAGLDIKTEYLSKKYIDNNKNINHSVDNYFYFIKTAYERDNDFWINILLQDLINNDKSYDPLNKSGFVNLLVQEKNSELYKKCMFYFPNSDYSLIINNFSNSNKVEKEDIIDLIDYCFENNINIGEFDYINFIQKHISCSKEIISFIDKYNVDYSFNSYKESKLFLDVFIQHPECFKDKNINLNINYKNMAKHINNLEESIFDKLLNLNLININLDFINLLNNQDYKKKLLKFINPETMQSDFDKFLISQNQNNFLKEYFFNLDKNVLEKLFAASKYKNLSFLLDKIIEK